MEVAEDSGMTAKAVVTWDGDDDDATRNRTARAVTGLLWANVNIGDIYSSFNLAFVEWWSVVFVVVRCGEVLGGFLWVTLRFVA